MSYLIREQPWSELEIREQEHQRNWDEFSRAITCGCNCQVHRSTRTPPFELVLSRPPVTLSLEDLPSSEGDAETTRAAFLPDLERLMSTVRTAFAKAQQRYRWNYDQHVRHKNKDIWSDDRVFVRVETFPEKPEAHTAGARTLPGRKKQRAHARP